MLYRNVAKYKCCVKFKKSDSVYTAAEAQTDAK